MQQWVPGKASFSEICAWACYDVANSTWAVVCATAVYNAYFVEQIAGKTPGIGQGTGTVLLTAVICMASLAVVFTAPVFGTIADATASKKKFLLFSTALCVLLTAALGPIGPGHYIEAMAVLTLATFAFYTGEDFIAAFLPELASVKSMGRVSAFGWAAGYLGGLFSLGACLIYVNWARSHGQVETQYVPVVMCACSVCFAVFSCPTFMWLKERAIPDPTIRPRDYVRAGFSRLRRTLGHARHYRDLFNFLLTLMLYSCGTTTVVHLASVYAQQVMHFTVQDCIKMILVVDITAIIGAVSFGWVQDRIGAVRTLFITLSIWVVAILLAGVATSPAGLWVAGNLIGISMGATGSVGRALVSEFSPPGRSGEFLGLWGVAVKLATAIGAVTFGALTYLSGNNYRFALLSIIVFFFAGLALLLRVNERRGRMAAMTDVEVRLEDLST